MYISSNQTSRLVDTMRTDCGSLSGRKHLSISDGHRNRNFIAINYRCIIINAVTEFVKHRPIQIDGRL